MARLQIDQTITSHISDFASRICRECFLPCMVEKVRTERMSAVRKLALSFRAMAAEFEGEGAAPF